MEKKYVFVTGCARSGTTAITLLLNQHPLIALGMERYKHYVNKENIEKINPSLFRKDRFFDFKENDTNILPHLGCWVNLNKYSKMVVNCDTLATLVKKHHFFDFKNNTNVLPNQNVWDDFYKQIFDKYSQTTIVGDKLPAYYNFYDDITKTFNLTRWIFMLRNIEDVAVSYNARARNKNDSWPINADYQKAVAHWNTSLRKTWQYINKGYQNVFCCEYEKFFSYNSEYLKSLLYFLNIDYNLEIKYAYRLITRDWNKKIREKNALKGFEINYIKEKADFALRDNVVEKSLTFTSNIHK